MVGRVKTLIAKRFTFDAAHQLPNHDGKCRRLHGHTYVIEVQVSGPVRPPMGEPDEGMVLDFGVISAVWKGDLEPMLDHRFLNETLPTDYWPTTAENIARFLLDAFTAGLDATGVVVERVRVWETPTSCATVES